MSPLTVTEARGSPVTPVTNRAAAGSQLAPTDDRPAGLRIRAAEAASDSQHVPIFGHKDRVACLNGPVLAGPDKCPAELRDHGRSDHHRICGTSRFRIIRCEYIDLPSSAHLRSQGQGLRVAAETSPETPSPTPSPPLKPPESTSVSRWPTCSTPCTAHAHQHNLARLTDMDEDIYGKVTPNTPNHCWGHPPRSLRRARPRPRPDGIIDPGATISGPENTHHLAGVP